jgi:AraC family transcriptional regulator
MMEEISIVDVPAQWVLGMRRKGRYTQIAPMIMAICQYTADHRIPVIAPPVYLWHERTVENAMQARANGAADVEVVIPVGKNVKGAGEIQCYELDGGPMATIMHTGPYEECSPTYEKLFAWLEQQGRTITGPIREVYLNDPREVPKEEILTQIFAPVG